MCCKRIHPRRLNVAARRMLAVLALLLWPALPASAAEDAAPPSSLPPEAAYGQYAVGVATGFAVDALAHLDPWNGFYGSAEYQTLLRRIDASGQRRTVVFQLWYPAPPSPESQWRERQRSPLPAASGRRANYHDFFFRDPHIAVRRTIAGMAAAEITQVRPGGALAEMSEADRQAALSSIGGKILETPQGAWQDATAAEGRFPVILVAHGLGGNHAMWGTFAEFLASHGYIVAAPTFVSDGTLPLVFHDEDSPFRNEREWSEVAAAHEQLSNEAKVVPYFHRLLFDGEADPAKRKAVPGGVERATTMMRNLFRQRLGDVALMLRTVLSMGMDEPECRTALASMGATSAARPTSNSYLCDLLNGRIDAENIGAAGHSLGSMTAQLAANHLPAVDAAFGLNNAPPFKWTPEEMLGGSEGGVRKPLLLMVGDEDAFVQSIFIGLFTTAVREAGGDAKQAFPLAAERAAPDRMTNPQPVALSGWQRARSDRFLVIVRDVGHDTLVNEAARLFPWPAFVRGELPFGQDPSRTRKATGDAAFASEPPVGERYDELGWTVYDDGQQAYLPHVVRDWYALAWFDWHLKGDENARARLAAEDPFGAHTHVRKEMR